jgi:hypothetical protein
VLFEEHRQLRVGGVFMAAGWAPGEVPVDRCALLGWEASASAIDEMGAYFVAVHVRFTSSSP